MVGQQGLWDEEERLAKLARKKPSLERLKAAIPWEEFRPLLESAFAKESKSPADRKRTDVIVMFRMGFMYVSTQALKPLTRTCFWS